MQARSALRDVRLTSLRRHGRSALRSAAHGDIIVPSHRTDWGLMLCCILTYCV